MNRTLTAGVALAGALVFAAPSKADLVLKYVTQTAASAADSRKVAPKLIADTLAASNVGVSIKVYFDGELMATSELWRGVREGAVDMVSVYLPAVVRDVPELALHGLPAILTRFDDIPRLNSSPAVKQLGEVLESKGVVVLGGYWDALAIGSTGDCVRRPVDLEGLVARAPGRAYEMIVEAGGAIPVPFASPEIPRALKTGAVDLVISTPSALVTGNGHKYLKCVTDPAAGTPGMVFVATIIAKPVYDKLSEPQREAVRAAAAKGGDYLQADSRKYSAEAIEQMRRDGAQVVKLDDADLEAWRGQAEALAHRDYGKASPAAATILQSARKAVARN